MIEGPALERLRAAMTAPGSGGRDCVNSDRLWAAVQGELSPLEVRELVLHAAQCSDCALAWRLARELAVEVGLPIAGKSRLPEPVPWWRQTLEQALGAGREHASRWTNPRVWAVVALAAVAIILMPVLTRSPEAPPSMRREDQRAVHSLMPDAPVPRQQFVLRWSDVGRGARYSFTVTTADLAPVFSRAGLLETQAQVPEEALAKLPAGAELVWTVEALLPDGSRLSSPAFVTRVK